MGKGWVGVEDGRRRWPGQGKVDLGPPSPSRMTRGRQNSQHSLEPNTDSKHNSRDLTRS